MLGIRNSSHSNAFDCHCKHQLRPLVYRTAVQLFCYRASGEEVQGVGEEQGSKRLPPEVKMIDMAASCDLDYDIDGEQFLMSQKCLE